MTNDEMQKTMQFILEQQAQTSLNLQKLEEAHSKAESRISRLEGAVVGVVNLIDRLTNAQERTDASVNELATRMNELADSQKRTDDRLNILINSVERYISEGRNGKPPERT